MNKTKNKLKTDIKRIKLETKYCKLLHFSVLARFSTLRSRTIETKALGTGVLRILWASQWSLWGNFWNLEVFFWQIISKSTILSLREKYPNRVFSGPHFPAFGPEKTPYLDTFLAVPVFWNKIFLTDYWSQIFISKLIVG